jgi:hypothetical protein
VLLILFNAAGYWKLDVGGYVLLSWIYKLDAASCLVDEVALCLFELVLILEQPHLTIVLDLLVVIDIFSSCVCVDGR